MNKWNKKWRTILFLILALFIIILLLDGFLYLSGIVKKSLENSRRVQTEETNKLIYGDASANYWLGAANPKVILVEFGDYACPYCEKMFPKIREIGIKYKNSVKIIFRDYPVISESSALLALSARCAGEQGLFWLMHDKLFLNQGMSQPSDILRLANQIGVNTDKFAYCFDNKIYLPEIERDLNDGNQLDIAGTPTLFINGERFSGDVPYDQLISAIEQKISE